MKTKGSNPTSNKQAVVAVLAQHTLHPVRSLNPTIPTSHQQRQAPNALASAFHEEG